MKKNTIIALLFLYASCAFTQDTLSVQQLDERLLDFSVAHLDTANCNTIATLPTYPDSVYKQRLQQLPNIIEMTYNHVVRRYIEQYSRHPKQISRLMYLSERYMPLFEDILCKYNLPEELKYMPVVESGLNALARSQMGAAGMWQFMPTTAKKYGLEVNSLVDERYDVYKSTDAACRFLISLYSIYNDWNLAIAAYNCGPGNINKAIHRSGGKRDFWDIYDYLPKETRNYLPLFVAANYILNYAQLENVCPTPQLIPVSFDTVLISDRVHLTQIAEVLEVPIDTLRRLNPQYLLDIVPGSKTYSICLPLQAIGDFIDLQDTICNYKTDSLLNNRRAEIDLAHKTASDGYRAKGTIQYKVKKGDTLGSIAKHFHCKVSQLQKWNSLKSTNIRAGQTLKIHR
ncbi:MAG: transglycosylase SLT domain-containing protein [Paludibacteraceae bacterium]|nr:transglycosylase SLT domain-containing protein [Paludibacteraceae bacterium]